MFPRYHFAKTLLITLIIQLVEYIIFYLVDDFYRCTLWYIKQSAATIGLPRFAARATSL